MHTKPDAATLDLVVQNFLPQLQHGQVQRATVVFHPKWRLAGSCTLTVITSLLDLGA